MFQGNIVSFLNSLDVCQLKEVLQISEEIIASKLNKTPALAPHGGTGNEDVNIENFVEYYSDFISSDDKDLLEAELESLSFQHSSSSPDKVINHFVSLEEEPYSWESIHGHKVSLDPHDLNKYPVMKRIMQSINEHQSCKLNLPHMLK